MQFAKQLRERVKQGAITTSIRIWIKPRVKIGGQYRLEDGHVHIDDLKQIDWDDVTLKMAQESGFADVEDLMKTAKHGIGENVYLVRFHYVEGDDYSDERNA